MEMKVLKDLLLQQGLIDRYFEGHVPIHLWRALKNKKGKSLFSIVEEPFILSNGRPRPADIKVFYKNGQKWVSIFERPRGISTFDAQGVPAGKDWFYYLIPAGTVLPPGLAIVRDEYNARFSATHYTIAPAYDMPLAMFKLLLNQLAANAAAEVA